ncbi:MAG: hypothetical protein M3P85_06380 [Actinomycetota bacterium]|nr:hypothetical protein [Actinomycetota bacterium]
MDWLGRPGSGHLLAQLFEGTIGLSHGALDDVGSKAADHLRCLLVAAGVLAERDEALVRLERWIDAQLLGIGDAEDRHLVEAFATWEVLRRRRQHAARRGATGDTTASRRVIRATIELLGWLGDHHRRLDDMTQADVDLWLATGPAGRRSARSFLRWAATRGVARAVVITAEPRRLPAATITADQLQAVVRRLVTDDSLPAVERAGGLLVTLYGQPATRVVRLRVDDVSVEGDDVALRLGRHRVVLPPVLGRLVVELVADRRGPARTGAPPTSRWLFPGGRPGRALTGDWLAARIAAHGLPVSSLRNAALMELASQLPAVFLADLLGIATNSAVRWSRAAGGEWANYAGAGARHGDQRTFVRTGRR